MQFLAHGGMHGFLLLGSVVLCVTGGEALYADMGHFGKTPIRIAWSLVVFPGLLLNYFGQGALFLEHGAHGVERPVLRPRRRRPLLIPMMLLATAGRDHRVAGADLGRVLADEPGRAARLLAARHGRPHVAQDRGPDLHPRGQLRC